MNDAAFLCVLFHCAFFSWASNKRASWWKHGVQKDVLYVSVRWCIPRTFFDAFDVCKQVNCWQKGRRHNNVYKSEWINLVVNFTFVWNIRSPHSQCTFLYFSHTLLFILHAENEWKSSTQKMQGLPVARLYIASQLTNSYLYPADFGIFSFPQLSLFLWQKFNNWSKPGTEARLR